MSLIKGLISETGLNNKLGRLRSRLRLRMTLSNRYYSLQRNGPIRIGCASGFWGDTPTAVPQLVKGGNLDYLVLDYLSEVTMSLLVGAQRKMPELGWCPDFLQDVGPYLPEMKGRGVKVITNAGGVNPHSCMKTLVGLAEKMNVAKDDFKIAVITGDNVLKTGHKLGRNECPNPETVASANAYLGAGPIARALDLGADIIITGRCTDSALALGPLIHSFKWDMNDFDLMAKGSLAGHLIECGAQSTGGIFTDWESITGWENNGFPIAVCEPNGDFSIAKPEGTGGKISRGTVAEQLVYEIGDPKRYILPDVICDFSQVQLEEQVGGNDLVKVTGARGQPPTEFYKVGGTYQDGWKCVAVCPIIGPKARVKGHKTAEAIIKRCRGLFKSLKFPDFQRIHVQMLGMEEGYGKQARQTSLESRDGVLWISVHHQDKKALERFAKEIASAGTGMAPGFTTVISGRPKPSPLLNFFSYLKPKNEIKIEIELSSGHKEIYNEPINSNFSPVQLVQKESNKLEEGPDLETGTNSYKLSDLAYLRSGDKGDTCNIGVIARNPQIYPFLKKHLTAQLVGQYFQHKFSQSDYEKLCSRYELPGIQGLNFVLENSLGGGGIASLTPDPQGKGFAQQLADFQLNNLPKLI